MEFNNFTHSEAIIKSHLENQYPNKIIDDNGFKVLFTSFDYHYFAGKAPSDTELIKNVLREHIKSENRDELILFEDSTEWAVILEKFIKEIKGVINSRYAYEFNKEKFEEVISNHIFNHNLRIIYSNEGGSNISYPVAEVVVNEVPVAYAKALMIGGNMVEIDVFTEEKYRNQGMSFEASLKLIEHLLEKGLKPCWNAWKPKIASHNLAMKCGFDFSKEIKAYIWVKDFGDF